MLVQASREIVLRPFLFRLWIKICLLLDVHHSKIHTAYMLYIYKLRWFYVCLCMCGLVYGNLIIFKWQNSYHFHCWWSWAISEYFSVMHKDYSNSCLAINATGNKQEKLFSYCFWQAMHHSKVVNCWFSTVIKIQIRQVKRIWTDKQWQTWSYSPHDTPWKIKARFISTAFKKCKSLSILILPYYFLRTFSENNNDFLLINIVTFDAHNKDPNSTGAKKQNRTLVYDWLTS